MATEKRLIDANALMERLKFKRKVSEVGLYRGLESAMAQCQKAPTVDAVPVDEIKLHHVIIDNEGVPEVKLQIGDRYFILRTDPLDAVEVVHGRWVKKTTDYVYYYACSKCGEPVLRSQWGNDFFSSYCPNCGAKMDGGNANATD